ncbi:hypothetical protein GCM10010193_30950 [Kitasatospora atroaurantiaca]|uniref:Copper(I)-binding protein n=1 Tax=Kitasatospora atroaurantiaca TaxID=285545 RepID=A0A561ER40_9ACTN|nr:DUF461 domain-containing protein [Kitasatospora atroaurantiaca]TWE18081.1 hypothetical protein FB465_3130 [Kitasatospora atroaurantiaca]
MSRSLRRGAIAALVLAAIVPLSACAAGNTPDTLAVTPDNASTSIGNDLKLNNIVVVTKADTAAEQTGPANVTVNISNSGTSPETLQSITVGEGSTATFTTDKGAPLSEIVIPAGGSVLLGGEGQPVAHLSSAALTVGGFAPTSFSFAKAGKVGTQAQVLPAKGPYAAYGPGGSEVTALPSATASVAPSASASASATASASTSASAGATASGSASASATATH